MSRHRHLPIWKAAMDLAVHLEHAVRRFPRYHKYTLGSELRQTAQRLCRLVACANDARTEQRLLPLDELVGSVEEMKTLITLAQEVKAFGTQRIRRGHRIDGEPRQTERGGGAASGTARSLIPSFIARMKRVPRFTVRPDRPVVVVPPLSALPNQVDKPPVGCGEQSEAQQPVGQEFSAADLPGVRKRMKRDGQVHALAAQTGHHKTGFKRREVVLIWRPPAGPAASPSSSFLSSRRGAS